MYAIYISSGGIAPVRHFLTAFNDEGKPFSSYEEAERYCYENGWEWIDDNGFAWNLEAGEEAGEFEQ